MEISKAGLFVTVLAFIGFAVLSFNLAGWWCVIIAPTLTLFASRPVFEGSGWAWERRIESE